MGSAGEKEKGRIEEKITRRGQKGCWVIKEIKKSEKGRGLPLCISPRTSAGMRASVTGTHFNTDVPSGKRAHHDSSTPFGSPSVMITPSPEIPSNYPP